MTVAPSVGKLTVVWLVSGEKQRFVPVDLRRREAAITFKRGRRWLGLALGLGALAVTTACLPPGTPPTFVSQRLLPFPAQSGATADSVAVGDVTGDGRADIVTATEAYGRANSGALLIYPQTSTGQLGPYLSVPTMANRPNDDQVVLADVNHDGHLDAVLADNAVEVFIQTAGRLTRTMHFQWLARDIQVADVNGDGRADLVTTEVSPANSYATVIKVHLQQANGSFGTGYRVGPAISLVNPIPKVSVADLNGDGRPDIVGFEQTGFFVSLNTGNGFGKAVKYHNIADSPGHYTSSDDLAVGDVNGDGRPDIVTENSANSPWGALEIFNGQPGGTFAAPRQIAAGECPSTLMVADVTGDGRNDVIVSQTGYNQIGVFAQRSDGTLSPDSDTSFVTAPNEQRELAVGDLNGDQLVDVVAVLGSSVQVLLQHA